MKSGIMASALAMLITVFAVGCGDDSASPGEGNGMLRVVMTDAPFPIGLVAEANVSIERVEMREKGSDDDADFIVLTDVDTVLNLIDLQNGLTATLVELEVPAGDYDEVRVITGDATIILTDSTDFDLKVPSGSQSGIKVKVSPVIHVEEGLTTELLLDFDLSKSFVVQGNPSTPAGINGFNFKPVIRAVNASTAGRVQGTVIADAGDSALANVYIVLDADESEEVYEAYTNENGEYVLLGIPTGTYTLRAELEGYETAEQSGISIVAANSTTVNLSLTAE